MKQLSFEKVNGWGGKRRGAGRKKSGLVSHGKRARVDLKKPILITVKLQPDVINLRHGTLMAEFRRAVGAAKKFGFYVVHFSLQFDHVHIFIEVRDNESLGRGMRSFGSCFGKSIRRLVGGKGSVFLGRYHAHILRTPTEVKNALKYVLLNYPKHSKLIEHIDDFSSGYSFREWKVLIGRKLAGLIADQLEDGRVVEMPELSPAQSWLAREGWKRAG